MPNLGEVQKRNEQFFEIHNRWKLQGPNESYAEEVQKLTKQYGY